jgi:hypothetical protein
LPDRPTAKRDPRATEEKKVRMEETPWEFLLTSTTSMQTHSLGRGCV